MWLAQNGMADPDNAGAGAYAYMDLMGLVSLGWMWLKMAAASQRALDEGTSDEPFHEAKLVTARFYAQRELAAVDRASQEDRGRRRNADEDSGRSLLAHQAGIAPRAPRRSAVPRTRKPNSMRAQDEGSGTSAVNSEKAKSAFSWVPSLK